jgi:hypothetical protein
MSNRCRASLRLAQGGASSAAYGSSKQPGGEFITENSGGPGSDKLRVVAKQKPSLERIREK